MSLQLLGQRIVIIPETAHETSIGGIYIPETSRQERNTGIIAAIGGEVSKEFKGRRCIFSKSTGSSIILDGVEGILLYSFDVIAFLN